MKKKRGEARDIMRATRLVPASFTVLYQLRVNDIQRLIPRPNPLRLYASPRLASRHACVSNQPPVYHSLHLLSRFLFFIFFFLLAIITRAISRASNFLPSLSSCRLFFTNFFSFILLRIFFRNQLLFSDCAKNQISFCIVKDFFFWKNVIYPLSWNLLIVVYAFKRGYDCITKLII